MLQEIITIKTSGREITNITSKVQTLVKNATCDLGLCNLFITHTSASLIICENADPSVRYDLENFMSRLAPDSTSLYQHNVEGKDDMPAHIRTVLTQATITIPIKNGALLLGTWQGIYLWEHRLGKFTRNIIVTISP